MIVIMNWNVVKCFGYIFCTYIKLRLIDVYFVSVSSFVLVLVSISLYVLES